MNKSEVFFNFATVTLVCSGQNETSYNFMLDNILNFTLSCGDSHNLTNLMAGTEYTIFRQYTDPVFHCNVTSFQTEFITSMYLIN